MNFFELVKARQSVRMYLTKPLEEDKLQQILRVANAAPSAGNLQTYEIYVVRERQHKLALARAAMDQYFIAAVPVALVFCAHPSLAFPASQIQSLRTHPGKPPFVEVNFMGLTGPLDVARGQPDLPFICVDLDDARQVDGRGDNHHIRISDLLLGKDIFLPYRSLHFCPQGVPHVYRGLLERLRGHNGVGNPRRASHNCYNLGHMSAPFIKLKC